MDKKQFDFTVEEISQLFRMQDTLNSYIHPEWKLQGFNWFDAIVDECQEILGHLGWKWWKESYQCGITTGNKAQLKLEVIDLLHFVVSGVAQPDWFDFTDIENFTVYINTPYLQNLDASVEMEMIARDLRKGNANSAICISQMAHILEMTKEEILTTYLHKYVLNKFRQDHGYKDGTYDKTWVLKIFRDGLTPEAVSLEDNEVLERAVEYLSNRPDVTIGEQTLYSELEFRYNGRLNKPSVG